jgi:hypothetical protein
MLGLSRRILWSILIIALPACSAARVAPVITPEERLNYGLAAWRAGEYELARLELSQLAADPMTAGLGERAQLLLAALELDPRNTDREPSVGVALVAELLGRPPVSTDIQLLGEVLYLQARDLGVAAPRDTTLLPRLPGMPLSAHLDSLLLVRDQQRLEIARLRQESKVKDQEIATLTKELERVRKALRP